MRLSFAAALLVLLAPPEFRGCAGDGDPPEDDTPLPPGEGCVTDADCAAMCMDVRCLAGACMTVGPAVDADRDGTSPDPCGDDCDDGDPGVFAGAPEQCDGRDNDCDSTVDEGAPRLDTMYPLMAGDRTSVVFPWGSGFVVTEATSSVLWGVPVAIDGRTGTPIEIMRLTMGTAFVRVAAAANGTQVLVASVTDLGVVRWVVIERDEVTGDARRVTGPATMPSPTDVQSLEVLAFGSGWAIGYDATTTLGPERLVTLDPTAEAVVRLPLSSLPASSFGFATDGTHIVLSDDAGNVVFFDPDGTEAGRHPIARPLTARPLASGSGSVVIAKSDDFDYVIAPLSLATGLGEEQAVPFGDATDVVRIATAGDVLVVSRSSFGATRIQGILASDLTTLVGSGLTFGRGIEDVTRLSAAESSGGIAVLGALATGPGADIGILAACAGGG